ncbi:hypothetical protein D3C71_2132560 [compost metagenome]
MIRYSNILRNTYSIFGKNTRKVDMTIKLYNVDEEEKKQILDKIQKAEYRNINELVDNLKIEEIFDNK